MTAQELINQTLLIDGDLTRTEYENWNKQANAAPKLARMLKVAIGQRDNARYGEFCVAENYSEGTYERVIKNDNLQLDRIAGEK